MKYNLKPIIFQINRAEKEISTLLNYELFNFYWNLGKKLAVYEIEKKQTAINKVVGWFSFMENNLFSYKQLSNAVKLYSAFPESSEICEIALLYKWHEIQFVFEVRKSEDCMLLMYHLINDYKDVRSQMKTESFDSSSFVHDRTNIKHSDFTERNRNLVECIHSKHIEENLISYEELVENEKIVLETEIILIEKIYQNSRLNISTVHDENDSDNLKAQIWQVIEETADTVNSRVNMAVNRNYWQIGRDLISNAIEPDFIDVDNKHIIQVLNNHFGNFFDSSFIKSIYSYGKAYNRFSESIKIATVFSWDFIEILLSINKTYHQAISEKLAGAEINIENFCNKVSDQILSMSDSTTRVEYNKYNNDDHSPDVHADNEGKESSMVDESIILEIDIDDVVTNAKPFLDKNSPLINMILLRYGLHDFFS